LVSGNTTTVGGASNVTGGGSGMEIPTLTSTAAIVMTGNTTIKAKKIIPKSNFFILSSPLLDPDAT
jgi:hypothetical protein